MITFWRRYQGILSEGCRWIWRYFHFAQPSAFSVFLLCAVNIASKVSLILNLLDVKIFSVLEHRPVAFTDFYPQT